MMNLVMIYLVDVCLYGKYKINISLTTYILCSGTCDVGSPAALFNVPAFPDPWGTAPTPEK